MAAPEPADPVHIQAGPSEYADVTTRWLLVPDEYPAATTRWGASPGGRIDPFPVLGAGDARPRDERSPISQERNR